MYNLLQHLKGEILKVPFTRSLRNKSFTRKRLHSVSFTCNLNKKATFNAHCQIASGAKTRGW